MFLFLFCFLLLLLLFFVFCFFFGGESKCVEHLEAEVFSYYCPRAENYFVCFYNKNCSCWHFRCSDMDLQVGQGSRKVGNK